MQLSKADSLNIPREKYNHGNYFCVCAGLGGGGWVCFIKQMTHGTSAKKKAYFRQQNCASFLESVVYQDCWKLPLLEDALVLCSVQLNDLGSQPWDFNGWMDVVRKKRAWTYLQRLGTFGASVPN